MVEILVFIVWLIGNILTMRLMIWRKLCANDPEFDIKMFGMVWPITLLVLACVAIFSGLYSLAGYNLKKKVHKNLDNNYQVW